MSNGRGGYLDQTIWRPYRIDRISFLSKQARSRGSGVARVQAKPRFLRLLTAQAFPTRGNCCFGEQHREQRVLSQICFMQRIRGIPNAGECAMCCDGPVFSAWDATMLARDKKFSTAARAEGEALSRGALSPWVVVGCFTRAASRSSDEPWAD